MTFSWLVGLGLLALSHQGQSLGVGRAGMGPDLGYGYREDMLSDSIGHLLPRSLEKRQSEPGLDPDFEELYPEQWLDVPVDHGRFHDDPRYEPHTNKTFKMRYWFDDQFYEPGGPIIVLSGGEVSGVGRLPFLYRGIVRIMASQLNGLGVILEHRYYGESYVSEDLSVENLRFLTTEQALEDTAYFAEHVTFPGYEDVDLTAPNAPWVLYGGSYAGGFVAFARKLYPELFVGAISSSGVTVAVEDFWEYYTAASLYAPDNCAQYQQKIINAMDNILLGGDEEEIQFVKDTWGLGEMSTLGYFASTAGGGISGLQYANWDPNIHNPTFFRYCGNLTSSEVLYPPTLELEEDIHKVLTLGGYEDEINELTVPMMNYLGYLNLTAVSRCVGMSQDDCFGSFPNPVWQEEGLEHNWRLWAYQYCTEWGFFQTGSGVPDDQLPMISRLVDMEFSRIPCEAAFNITEPPDVERINKFGGFDFSYPRVALLDGEADPWRAATPHKIELAPYPPSTPSEPRLLILGGAVHHWDENGLLPNETTSELPPPPVREAQDFIVEFTREWLKEWEEEK